MASKNFERVLELLLKWEGGYVDHPRDPGGATNKGVIQRVYNAYRQKNGEKPRSVKNITDAEVKDIYQKNYWNAVAGDELPYGLDYAVTDYAVNSGPSRAIRYLQRSLNKVEGRNLAKDGMMGPATINACQQCEDVHGVIKHLCDSRMSFLKRLSHWDAFGRGWSRRVKDVRRNALKMINEHGHTPKPVAEPDPSIGKPGDKKKSIGLLEKLIGFLTGSGAIIGSINNAFALVAVLGSIAMIAGFVYFYRKRKLRPPV